MDLSPFEAFGKTGFAASRVKVRYFSILSVEVLAKFQQAFEGVHKVEFLATNI